jgi:hypothetical protein
MNMSLRNRVDPWGRLNEHASKAGTVMGNRGILHDAEQRVVKRWTTTAWVACDPKFQGMSRKPLFSPNRYSELFFLDEATALSAGHRPCAYCQRGKFDAFKAAWAKCAEPPLDSTTLRIKEVDAELHCQRVSRGVQKITFQARVGSLANGTMIEVDGGAFLLHRGRRWRWSYQGYEPADTLPPATLARVLTPIGIVRMYSAGYQPDVHVSADA